MKAQVPVNTASVTRPKKQLALPHTRGVKDTARWSRMLWLVSDPKVAIAESQEGVQLRPAVKVIVSALLWDWRLEQQDFGRRKRRFVSIVWVSNSLNIAIPAASLVYSEC